MAKIIALLFLVTFYNFFHNEVESYRRYGSTFQRNQQYRPRSSIPAPNLASMLRRTGFTKFYELMRKAQMYSLLYDDDAYTVILPSKSLMENRSEEIGSARDFVAYHVFDGKKRLEHLQDGSILKSYNKQKAVVNKLYDEFEQKVKLWIQGIPVYATKIRVKNKNIYKIDTFLKKSPQTVYTYLKESGNHGQLFKLFRKQKLYFQFPYGTTFLAPLDLAFEKLPRKYKAKLFANDTEAQKFIRNHIIARPMCRERLFYSTGWNDAVNSLGNALSLYQHNFNKDSCYVNNGAVLTSATLQDGFVYGITEVLLPDVYFKVLETIRNLGCHTFLQHLITTGGMVKLSSILNVHTIFAPTDKAFESLPKGVADRLSKDDEYLKKVVMYHVTNGRWLAENFHSSSVFTSAKDVKDVGKYYKVNLFTGQKGNFVQNIPIWESDHLALNGIVHVLNNVLIPPKRTIYDILKKMKKLRVFRKALDTSDTNMSNHFKDSSQMYTVFAVTNKVTKRYLKSFENKNETETTSIRKGMILHHTTLGALILTNLLEGETVSLKTLAVNETTNGAIRMDVTKDKENSIFLLNGERIVIKKSLDAVNGIVHIVTKVFTNMLP